jgi:hypothetical protein
MRSCSERLKVAAGSLAFIGWLALGCAPAAATGTVVIRQADGHTDRYADVGIKIIHNALYVSTADGKSTLVINRAACSYQGKLMVCLVQNGTLVAAGSPKSLDLRHGTVYVNSTDDPQQLMMSTSKVAPHSLLLSFTTDRGTYLSLSGRIDKVVK